MCSVEGFRALFTFCILVLWCEAAPPIQDEALQQLRQLSLTQAKLIVDNSSAKCSLIPNLCDWQLHLYEGHVFSVPLIQPMENPTTPAPSKFNQEVFGLARQENGPQLFIVADVEPKSRRKVRGKRKLRRRFTLNHLSKQKFVLLVVQ
ncbi:uncharacterized protein LOC128256111 [Drosophila gunungcola]|uniref:Uncharacterized protein n=1 Tax=Drosophila gunungcola TaxID=103775 RepID=A0A9P9YH62_9MUSC|nr:uncharacterized protein LOC128256111 [Drosophila gunungcola]KAI8036895.1 hypothetical protein M5D96_010206 [Drosophila gunungcola]